MDHITLAHIERPFTVEPMRDLNHVSGPGIFNVLQEENQTWQTGCQPTAETWWEPLVFPMVPSEREPGARTQENA